MANQSIDFTGLADVNPFDAPAGFAYVFGIGQTLNNGWRVGTTPLFQCALTSTNLPERSTGIIHAQIIVSFDSSSLSGVFFGNSSGTGYQIGLSNNVVRANITTNGEVGAQIGSDSAPIDGYLNNPLDFYRDCATGRMWIELNGVNVFERTSNASATTDLRASIYSRAGYISSAIFYDIEPSIVSVNENNIITVGEAGTIITDSIIPTEMFVGDIEVLNFTEVSPNNYSYTIPSFTDMVAYPRLGANTVSVNDDQDPPLEATSPVTLQLPSGWSSVTYTSLSNAPDSLTSLFVDVSGNNIEIEVGDSHFFKTSEIKIYSDSTVENAINDTIETWIQKSQSHPTYPNVMIKTDILMGDGIVYLENGDGTISVEQEIGSWGVGEATGTLSGNWLDVYNEILPNGTTGVPFTFGIHTARLRLLYETQTATRPQNYLAPPGFTALEYSSSFSNTTNPLSIWNGLSGLINGDQILVSNSQTSDDSTPITVSWAANGVGTPSQNLNFTADYVYFDNSNGQLSLLDKSFVAQIAGIANVNSGAPLESGLPFTITLSNINANDVMLVYLEIPNTYKWILPVDNVINDTTLSCTAPNELPDNLNNITIRVKENKVARDLRSFTPENTEEINWLQSPQTTNFLASSFSGYLVDTTNSVVALTLPETPAFGDRVAYMDYAGTFGTNNFTINPNGNNLHGSPNNYVTSSNNESGTLFYSGSTQGWKFLNVNPTI